MSIFISQRKKLNEPQRHRQSISYFRLDVDGPYNRRYSDMEEYMKPWTALEVLIIVLAPFITTLILTIIGN